MNAIKSAPIVVSATMAVLLDALVRGVRINHAERRITLEVITIERIVTPDLEKGSLSVHFEVIAMCLDPAGVPKRIRGVVDMASGTVTFPASELEDTNS